MVIIHTHNVLIKALPSTLAVHYGARLVYSGNTLTDAHTSYVRMCIGMLVQVHACVCVHVCVHVCMNLCGMCVCMFVCVCM